MQVRIGGPMTAAVKILLISNITIFVLTFLPLLFNSSEGGRIVSTLFFFLGMTPSLFWSALTLWMPVTYMFLHAGLTHILFNMLALWMFGGDVEGVLGTRRFVVYYLVCGIGAGLTVALLQPILGPQSAAIPTVGASGAIYGLLLAYGLFFPERVILLGFIFPIKAKWFVALIGILVFFSSIGDSGGGVSHIAHLGGLVFGFLFIKRRAVWALFKSIPAQGKRRRPKLRVIDIERVRKMLEDEDDDQVIH